MLALVALSPQLVRPKHGSDGGSLQLQPSLVLHILLAVQIVSKAQGGLCAQPEAQRKHILMG